MDAMRIYLLLLPLCSTCFSDARVTLVKTIDKDPDFTPICTSEASNNITLIVCRIRTKSNSGEECRLLYRIGGDFVHECDSRFTLKTWNHTVFLHLTSLTPADSGNYSCECSKLDGTYIRYLKITVKENNAWSRSVEVIRPSALTAAVLLIILPVILGFVHGGFYNRREQPESSRNYPNEDFEEIEPYSIFIQKENGLYSTASMPNNQIISDDPNISASMNRLLNEPHLSMH